MEQGPGAVFALLLHDGFAAMTAEVTSGLAERGHPDVTATLEFTLQAIDGGIDTASELG
jgi:hypothetical protein